MKYETYLETYPLVNFIWVPLCFKIKVTNLSWFAWDLPVLAVKVLCFWKSLSPGQT